MTSLEYVKSQIVKLKDDLQHYTMVEKDSALASQIRYDLEQFETIERELQALEIIKKHILNRDMDTSGIYLEFHNGHYEPYYTIEIRDGIKRIVPLEEYDLLKEVLK